MGDLDIIEQARANWKNLSDSRKHAQETIRQLDDVIAHATKARDALRDLVGGVASDTDPVAVPSSRADRGIFQADESVDTDEAVGEEKDEGEREVNSSPHTDAPRADANSEKTHNNNRSNRRKKGATVASPEDSAPAQVPEHESDSDARNNQPPLTKDDSSTGGTSNGDDTGGVSEASIWDDDDPLADAFGNDDIDDISIDGNL